MIQLNAPDPIPYVVEDFDFQFSNGLLMTLSVAKELGDTVDLNTNPMAATFHFSSKSSPIDDDARLPAEDITILMAHVLSVAHRTRTIIPPTKQQKDIFQSTLIKAPKSVQ